MNTLQRRREMMQQSGSKLPSEYQQVEWIQCTGTQGLLLPGVSSFKLIVADLGGVERSSILSQIPGSNNPVIWITGSRIVFGSWGSVGMTLTEGVHTFEYNEANKIIADDVSFQNSHIYCYKDTKVRVFLNNPQLGYGTGKFLYLETIDANMKLYPCYRKSDNVAGAYDIVNDVFYTNAGTGSFIIGPDV